MANYPPFPICHATVNRKTANGNPRAGSLVNTDPVI